MPRVRSATDAGKRIRETWQEPDALCKSPASGQTHLSTVLNVLIGAGTARRRLDPALGLHQLTTRGRAVPAPNWAISAILMRLPWRGLKTVKTPAPLLPQCSSNLYLHPVAVYPGLIQLGNDGVHMLRSDIHKEVAVANLNRAYHGIGQAGPGQDGV